MVFCNGASDTGTDICSGEPQQESVVKIINLRPETPNCVIKEIKFIYRYVIGYSKDGTTEDQDENPSFRIVAKVFQGDNNLLWRDLYESPKFPTMLYNYDASEGGSTNN